MNSNETVGESLYVTRPYLPARDKFDAYVDEIWKNNILTNDGCLHNRLQENISHMFSGNCVTLTTNGHLALDLALHVLGITGEVITTPFSFASTTHALTWSGLTPVFCDVNENNLTIDASKIEALITEKTTAILPVHVYGNLCDMKKIQIIADKYNLKIIYDAAHAFGVKHNGLDITSYGDVTMFSFHATKLFHTIEGGALVYRNTELKPVFEASRNFGISQGYYNYIGTNAKMNEFQAAMGLCILPELDNIISERKKIVSRYLENLENVEGVRCLVKYTETVNDYHNYSYMPILIDSKLFGKSRDELFEALNNQKIFSRCYFSPLISDYPCYKRRFLSDATPAAAKAAEQVLCLPLFNGIGLSDVDRVCNTIINI